LPEHALAAIAIDDALIVDQIRRRLGARCDTPAATACCFKSLRKRSNDRPLWHDPARCAGAAARLGDAAAGRAGAGASWARVADENVSDIANAAAATRSPGKRVGIELTGE
jgi:hypothetical protein